MKRKGSMSLQTLNQSHNWPRA